MRPKATRPSWKSSSSTGATRSSQEVRTTRDLGFPWTLLISSDSPQSEVHPSDRFTLVPEQYIERVEISFRRKGTAPLGFTHKIIDVPADE